jgi:hypothetical protein
MGGACSTFGGEVYTGLWWGNLRERDHFENLDLDGRIILKWIFKKLREFSIEPLSNIKCRKFLD